MSSEEIDLSCMGRCSVCGKPIDLRDAGHELTTMEFEDPDDDRFTADDVRDAMVRALRWSGEPEDHAIADDIEEEGTYAAHEDCIEETSIPDIPTMEDFDDE